MEDFSFHDITQHFHEAIGNIQNKLIQKIYSKFSVLYFPYQYYNLVNNIDKETTDLLLLSFLEKYKFITYEFTEIPQSINFLKMINFQIPNSNFPNEQNIKYIDAVICVENYCLIIEKIDQLTFDEILSRTKASLLNFSKDQSKTTKNRAVFYKIADFCSIILKDQKNSFLRFTIHSVVGFLIQRFSYPSNYFNNPSFFKFDDYNDYKEQSIQKELDILFQQKSIDEDCKKEFALKLNLINKNENQINPKIYEFKENDFIELKTIHISNDKGKIKLVIHCESLYLFVVKVLAIPIKVNEINHEINFCRNHFHRCLMRFYGFVKNKKEQICGFVYEYMSNGNLYEYIQSNKKKNDYIFSLLTMIRIFEGIKYLHLNNCIHRDIKPQNILLNHDFVPFISDFETIKSIENRSSEQFTLDFASPIYASPEQADYSKYNISFPTDIFSFGALIYFIFQKENMKMVNENNAIQTIKNISYNIQYMFNLCIKFNPDDRITINEISEIIKKEILSFLYFENYLVNEDLTETKMEIKQYLLEILIQINDLNLIKNIFIFNKIYYVQDKSYVLLLLGDLYFKGKYIEHDYNKAISYYHKSAELNNSEAEFKLGNFYYEGKYVNQDYSQVIYYLELAAEQNNSKALFNLGGLYMFDRSVKKDYQKARKYLELSAKLNNPYALYILGKLYIRETGVPVDLYKSIQCFELASKNNLSISSLYLGFMYLSGVLDIIPKDFLKADFYFELYINQRSGELSLITEDYLLFNGLKNSNTFHNYFISLLLQEGIDIYIKIAFFYNEHHELSNNYVKSIKFFEFAAESNNLNAITCLAIIYLRGIGVEKNILKAIKYLELAAEQNDSDSLTVLGELYLFGLDVKQDIKKSIKYLESSAKLNNPEASYELGVLYLQGLDVNQDYIKAREYFEISSKFNNPNALLNLGFLYLNGLGVEKNYEKARKYYELSAKLKQPQAFVVLGNFYEKGLEVKQDIARAIYYYKLAAQSNNSYGSYSLGILYLNGIGVKKNMNKAIDYFEISAKQNNPLSLFMLGFIYSRNELVKVDYKKTIRYLTLSAKLNNSFAMTYLGYLYAFEKDYKKSIEYFELAAKYNEPCALFELGNLYSNGIYINADIENAIIYFERCIDIQKQKIVITSKDDFMLSSYIKNYFYYIANNNLGLIYLIILKNNDKAMEYIKEAGFNEYPFGQNNLGILNEYFFNNIEYAKYMYQKASKNNFALADFNLGRIYEKQGQIKESIECYISATEKENKPLIFQFNEYDDEQLYFSKLLLFYLIDLKLTKYFYMQEDKKENESKYKKTRYYFIKSIERLIRNFDDDFQYHFKFILNTDHINEKYVSSFIINFILNFPIFDFSNELEIINKIESEIKDDKKVFEKNYKNKKIDCEFDSTENVIYDNPGEFFEFFIQNKNRKQIFIKSIEKTIGFIENIIYRPPYEILFGRIHTKKLKSHLKEIEIKNKLLRNIDKSFYEGFGIK